MNPLSDFWLAALSSLTFAFQPIVDIRTGAVAGYEALLRGFAAAGFPSIPALFDASFRDGRLYALDRRLREKALALFVSIPGRDAAKLLYNLDNRITEMPDYSPGYTRELADRFGLEPRSLVFEVSERHEFSDYEAARRVLDAYKAQGFGVALDDFGAGYSGLQLLYYAEPDVVKIDRFFIDGIDRSERKRLFVGQIVRMAALMGIAVVAEGVETAAELAACREAGADYAQGYYVARPAMEIGGLRARYPLGVELADSLPPEGRIPRWFSAIAEKRSSSERAMMVSDWP
jgi:EAL domain-containing protein (putative c-di-GMP-specific phosphodiesterase class I)